MRFSRIIPVLTLAISLTGLVACGGSGSSTASYTVPADADLIVKAVPTIRWDSPTYTAKAGDIKVLLANDDNVKHILVILDGQKVVGELELVVANKGDSDVGTINLPAGNYNVYCVIPGHSGMNSPLTVT